MSKQMDAGAAKTRPGRAGTLFGVLAALCLAWLCLTSARAQDAQAGPVRPGHVAVELVPSFAVIAPGQGRVLIALRQEIDPGWHTYWKNPGDSGEPTRLDWTLPPGVSAGGILWPAPEPIPVGPLLNHGYKDSVTLLVPLEIGAGLSPGETVRLEAFATWLVCEEICIPEEARLALELPVAAEPVPHPYWGPRLAEAEAALPAPSPWAAGYALAGERLRVWVGAPELAASLSARAVETLHLFPEADGFLAYAAPQSVRLGPEGITIEAQAGYKAGELAAAGAPLPALLTFTDALAGAGPVRHAFDLVAGPAP
ncbi:MAG: thiol:disulfide interchange protein, partial [Alphaproteobacteria bacterium]|nr:thiol:disulfide interchange protein [Alphaproteobacteria bacterium]